MENPVVADVKNFDPKTAYRIERPIDYADGRIPHKNYIKALILLGKMSESDATIEELTRMVKYAMVVACIKRELIYLDYKKAYEDFNIRELEEKYGGRMYGDD